MKKVGCGIALVMAALASAGPAAARHSDPSCTWGRGTLPDSDLVRVSVERPHGMQNCETRVEVALLGQTLLALGPEREPEQTSDSAPGPRTAEPKPTKAKRCKHRKAKRRNGKQASTKRRQRTCRR